MHARITLQAIMTGLIIATLSGQARAGDGDEAEGGIGIGDFSRLSLQISAVEVAPGRDGDTDMLNASEYESSTPVKLAYDLASMFLPSVNGNKHGFEGQVSVTILPFDFDLWAGTDVTMLALGDGGLGTIRLRGGFGVGVSYNHAYAYLKAQAAAVIIPDHVSVEAGVFWIPNQVSRAWGEREGDFDEQRRRASLFVDRGKSSRKFELYLEQIDRQRGGHGEDLVAEREDFTVRDPDDDMRGIGIGISLMVNFD